MVMMMKMNSGCFSKSRFGTIRSINARSKEDTPHLSSETCSGYWNGGGLHGMEAKGRRQVSQTWWTLNLERKETFWWWLQWCGICNNSIFCWVRHDSYDWTDWKNDVVVWHVTHHVFLMNIKKMISPIYWVKCWSWRKTSNANEYEKPVFIRIIYLIFPAIVLSCSINGCIIVNFILSKLQLD